jgi:hypothetical protein
MKKLYCILLSAMFFGTGYAQFTQTDEFNYKEDQSSHSYFTTGYSNSGAYVCPGDSTLRCGNCGISLGSAWVTLAVTPNCDSIRIDHLMAWGSNALLRVDGVNITTIAAPVPNCTWQSVLISNATAFTADGQIVLEIADTILTCSGDFQIARVKIFSNPVLTTGIFSSAFSEDDFSVAPNPSIGIFILDFKNNVAAVRAIEVYNAAGEIVFSAEGADKKVEIDLSKSATGIYFLKVVAEGGVGVRKIVLQSR